MNLIEQQSFQTKTETLSTRLPINAVGLQVLSLFDGMSCGQQALDRLNIKVDNYFASEIDKYAIQVTMANYPNTIQLGSVVNVDSKTICLSEVYSYICKKYFNNDIQSLQSIISEWEMLHRIDKEQTFSAYFGTQKSNEEQKAQPNTTLSINDRIWFWKREMGNNKGVYDIIRSGNRGKISNKIDVGELCKHSFWWNGDRQPEYRTSEENFIGANGIKEIGNDKTKITRNSHQTVFNNRSEGTSKDESIRTISKPTKKEKLLNSNEEIGQEINGREEEKNRINEERNQISENERFIQTNYEVNGISEIDRVQLSIYKKIQVTIIECEWGIIIFKGAIQVTFGGSPCQSFSFAGKRKGMSTKDEQEILTLEHYLQLKSEGFEFEGQSYLFWEYMRLLNECKPTYFLLENVEMGEKWEKVLSKAIGVNGIHINSALVSAQNRKRIYWTNIGMQPSGLFGDLESIIEQPKDRGILLKDILQDNPNAKFYLSNKMVNYVSKSGTKNFYYKPEFANPEGKAKPIVTKHIYRSGTTNYICQEVDEKYFLSEKVVSRFKEYNTNSNIVGTTAPDFRTIGQRDEVYDDFGKMGCLNDTDYKQPKQIIVHNTKPQLSILNKEDVDNTSIVDVKLKKPNVQIQKTIDKNTFIEGEIKALDFYNQSKHDKCPTLADPSHGHLGLIAPTKSINAVEIKNNYIQWDSSGKGNNSQGERAYFENGKSGTLSSGSENSGQVQPKVLVTNALTSVQKDNLIKQLNPSTESGGNQPYQQNRVYDVDGISPALNTDGRSHAVEVKALNENQQRKFNPNINSDKANALTLAQGRAGSSDEYMDAVNKIANITSRIRRLTPKECMRLQTVDDDYKMPVSDSQKYKVLGNGWTIDVIAHILSYGKWL